MTVDAMRFLYGEGKICVCRASNLRDERNRVVDWDILRVVDTIDEARAVLARFDQDGIRDTVAINPSGAITDPTLAARFIRVYYGLQ